MKTLADVLDFLGLDLLDPEGEKVRTKCITNSKLASNSEEDVVRTRHNSHDANIRHGSPTIMFGRSRKSAVVDLHKEMFSKSRHIIRAFPCDGNTFFTFP